eukprot:Partr_v1_DN28109_c1_g1_i2_m55050 putative Dynein, cytoplasmic 2, light intermediate chain 1
MNTVDIEPLILIDQSKESYALVIGPKSSGKTSMINSWLEKSDQATPTVLMEYSFARKSKAVSSLKDICNIWDVSTCDLPAWFDITLADSVLHNSFVVVCVDLSSPFQAVDSSYSLLSQLHSCLEARLASLEKRGSKRPKMMKSNALKRGWTGHLDLDSIKPAAIPVILLGLRHDVFVKEVDPVKRESLNKLMRGIAHSFGCSLLYQNSSSDEASSKMRKLLNNMAFKSPLKNQQMLIGTDDCVYVPAGADTFESIGISKSVVSSVDEVRKCLANIGFQNDNFAIDISIDTALSQRFEEPSIDKALAGIASFLQN